MVLRQAAPGDAETLRDLERTANLAALRHIFDPARHPYPDADALAHWRSVLQDPAVTVLLADEHDRPTGFAAYNSQWLLHLGVHPDRWGSGLAARLTDAVCADMAARGTSQARLWVLADNHRARRFYERTGWTQGTETSTAAWPPYPPEVDYRIGLDVPR